MKKETNLGWPDHELIYSKCSFSVCLKKKCCNATCHHFIHAKHDFLFSHRWNVTWTNSWHDLWCTKGRCLCFRAQNTLQRPISCKMPFLANFVKPSTGLYPANLSRCQNVVPNAEVEPGDLALFSLSTGLFAAVYLYHRLIQPRLMALNVCGLMRAGHVGLIGLVIPLLFFLETHRDLENEEMVEHWSWGWRGGDRWRNRQVSVTGERQVSTRAMFNTRQILCRRI